MKKFQDLYFIPVNVNEKGRVLEIYELMVSKLNSLVPEVISNLNIDITIKSLKPIENLDLKSLNIISFIKIIDEICLNCCIFDKKLIYYDGNFENILEDYMNNFLFKTIFNVILRK